jgi:prevent-host-death family protein
MVAGENPMSTTNPKGTFSLTVAEAREKLPKLIRQANALFERFIITSQGKPKAVVMSYDEFESWQETLDIVSNPDLMAAIKEADTDLAAGRIHTYEEVFARTQPGIK